MTINTLDDFDSLRQQVSGVTSVETLDQVLADLQERGKQIMELLQRDAKSVAGQFNYIATATAASSMAQRNVDMNKLASVFAWQNRLTEIMRQYEVLSELRKTVEASK